MKILFLSNYLDEHDGVSRLTLNLAEILQGLGHEVLCLTSKKISPREVKELPILKSPLEYLANPINSFLTARKIQRVIDDFSPDIIHFMAEPYIACLPFLKTKKGKSFLTVHGTYAVIPVLLNNPLKKIISSCLFKESLRKLDGITAVSQYTKDYLLSYYPSLKEKTQVIGNGINITESKIVDPKDKLINKIKRILFVGAIKGRKGILEAVEACNYYRNNIADNFIFNIIGDPRGNDAYIQLVKNKLVAYNLADKIFFRGMADEKELNDYYLNADLFLMPTLHVNNNFDGFGLVFLEANARGVPCIGSKESGAGEAIIDGQTGYLVNPHNPEEIAQRMSLVLNENTINPTDCLSWARNNDIKIKAEELVDFYQRLS
jgi:glycosyltransferase involved in cell wall biosynthesis